MTIKLVSKYDNKITNWPGRPRTSLLPKNLWPDEDWTYTNQQKKCTTYNSISSVRFNWNKSCLLGLETYFYCQQNKIGSPLKTWARWHKYFHWYWRLCIQNSTLSALVCVKLPQKFFYVCHFFDQIAPSPWRSWSTLIHSKYRFLYRLSESRLLFGIPNHDFKRRPFRLTRKGTGVVIPITQT